MKFLVWLSGNDPAILARCPTERMKCAATGATVAVVSLLATISGTATTHAFLHLPFALALAAGVFWGAAIMTLDRWFLISIRRQSTTRGTLAIASPRVLLAIISAIVISAPILLSIFHTEIDTRARTERQAAYAAAWHKLEQHFADVGKLEAETKGIEHELTSVQTGSAALADPEYKRLKREASQFESQANEWRGKAACEADGSCGDHRVGEGPRWKEKHKEATHLGREAEATRNALTQIGGELKRHEESSAEQLDRYRKQQLTAVQTHLSRRLGERKNAEAELNQTYGGNIGLLDRIEALGSLSLEHPFMGVATFLIALLIVLIDASPALGKAALSVGEPTLLEKTQDEVEAEAFDAIGAWRAARQKAHEIETSIVIEEAKLRLEREREMLNALIPQEITVQRKFREEFIRQWAKRVEELTPGLIAEALRDYSPNRAAQNGTGPSSHPHNRPLDGRSESPSGWRNVGRWPRSRRRAA